MLLKFSNLVKAASVALLFMSAPSIAGLIDFNDYSHGTVIHEQYRGVTITANNINPLVRDYAVVYDTVPGINPSEGKNNSYDPDLEGPNWGNSNIDDVDSLYLGRVLIVQENNEGCDTGVCTKPDDEGDRPAGSIDFEFDTAISDFGFDLLDVEGPQEYGQDSGYLAAFYDENGVEVAKIGFGSFVNDGINNAQYGDNSVNRISPIDLTQYGNVYRVQIQFGGSAGIDNVRFTEVPEPSTSVLFGLVLAGLIWRRKRA
ncbi:PEP-CTERM sorting domain-containing protein [Echinimonas agarilytica]|uniref:PEP-CTERM sorting domain-containing protein n=1 Tax=Echinimonas agarilytica TaxID=1215918 RepID=A0AA42B8F1_9GAMM|nr:PEP-CTERM sorting domain-containing protein [Echinimonas agarilytica]MCM2680141.1 PEP-CTERM sorting domain-containing protein [Echinimonas agarilytica]